MGAIWGEDRDPAALLPVPASPLRRPATFSVSHQAITDLVLAGLAAKPYPPGPGSDYETVVRAAVAETLIVLQL